MPCTPIIRLSSSVHAPPQRRDKFNGFITCRSLEASAAWPSMYICFVVISTFSPPHIITPHAPLPIYRIVWPVEVRTSFGWHSYASCQSDTDQLRRQSGAFSAAGPRVWNYLPTDLIRSLKTFFYSVRGTKAKRSVDPPPFNCALEILLLTCRKFHRNATTFDT